MTGDSARAELLLVEDNPQDLELALRALKKANLSGRVQVARDGVEALDYVFCEGPFAQRRIIDCPSVIVLDLKLPKINGLEVVKRIKDDPRTRCIPVVVLTSSKERNDIIECYRRGANCYIVKPVNFEHFASAVRDLGFFWLVLNQPPKVKD